MNRKPELFVNKIDKKINNNEKVYYSNSNKESSTRKQPKKGNKNITQKINTIFSSNNYIYKADVKIKLNNGEVIKKIVGRNNKNLITMDNELIPINDIIDIEKN